VQKLASYIVLDRVNRIPEAKAPTMQYLSAKLKHEITTSQAAKQCLIGNDKDNAVEVELKKSQVGQRKLLLINKAREVANENRPKNI